MTLPPIPKGRDWSPETWRTGLDEAVRLANWKATKTWAKFCICYTSGDSVWHATIAHATTLLDAGIVKPVVSEGAVVWAKVLLDWRAEEQHFIIDESPAAIAVIDAALAKARAGA
jgi:hypothetical protein